MTFAIVAFMEPAPLTIRIRVTNRRQSNVTFDEARFEMIDRQHMMSVRRPACTPHHRTQSRPKESWLFGTAPSATLTL